ncbi:GNAT family N-acetyltransferase [Spirillospora sp. NPDC048911]|uniref:GNAT family N-acetyltransferase n=1 Tax=Spirillospora sp. NPDC048911 TaxID=3364527 RepID=UPI003720969B
MRETVTYLEMTSPDDLDPANEIPTVTLAPATPEIHRALNIRIGEKYLWESVTFTEAQWAEYLTDPNTQTWVIRFDQQNAGLARYAITPPEVEITTFGLAPEFVGRGIGAYALTLTLQKAWELSTTRVWLHTSTLDHPNALPNYQKRGLRPFRVSAKPDKDPGSAE